MKKLSLILVFWHLIQLTSLAQQLQISQDKRYITTKEGKPFFWLGDTAWELFHRLNREEADLYLQNRADKGFNVIQAVVLAELDGLNDPNPYGDTPLIGNDPTKPNEAYFKHVDYIVNKANELGMFVGMLPTWGDKFNKQWGVGPVIFNAENAYVYGKFLGQRYRDKRIIWILGGDRNPDGEAQVEMIRSMAKGIRDAIGQKQIMTYHPMGGHNSSTWFHNDNWLDLNMFQSGHGEVNNQNYKITQKTYALFPAKPVLDGEPCYEDHPINWRGENGWFDDFDSRRAGWWSMLAGACGHTYGNHNIWQMWQPGRQPISVARTPWYESINYPGAYQAGYMKAFFESIPWQKMVPDSGIIKSGPNTNGKEVLAAAAQDGTCVVAYSPYGMNFNLDLSKMRSDGLLVRWFNPRNNSFIDLNKIMKADTITFDPPGDPGRGNDWVLLVQSE
jgi:hypothetical protein